MPGKTRRKLLPEGILRKRHWTREDARKAISALERSGLSVGAFASRTGVDAWRLYQWRKRLATTAAVPAAAFVEIKTTGFPSLEVQLRTGHVVRVVSGFDEDTLRRVVKVLEKSETGC